MKMVPLLLLLIAEVGRCQEFQCPRDIGGRCIDGNLPNPLDCGSFYQCSNCYVYRQRCQSGLHYSWRLDQCVYPQEAKCRVSPYPTTGTPAMTTVATTESPTTVVTESPTTVVTESPTTVGTEAPTTAGEPFTEETVPVTQAPTQAPTEAPTTTQLTTEAVSTVEPTTEVVTTPEPKVGRTAVFVALDDNQNTPGRVQFKPILDLDRDYQSSTYSFIAPGDGLYFQSISAGAFDYSPVDMILQEGLSADITRVSYVHEDHDTTSRDTISPLQAGREVYVTHTTQLYSDSLYSSSWTVFSLAFLNNNVSFSVGRTRSYFGPMDPVIYDKILVNQGNGWDAIRNVFVAPVSGIYYFSMSFGAESGTVLAASFVLGQSEIARILRGSTTHNGVDTLSRAFMINLNQGDEVRVTQWANDSAIFSFDGLETSFTGFLYDPFQGGHVAWSVGLDEGVNVIPEYIPGIQFDKILVNQPGDVWRPGEQAVVIPTSGYYYIHLSAGAVQLIPVHLFLTVNDQPRLDLWRASTAHNGPDTLSRSGLVRLQQGDRLKVGAARATAVYSDNGAETSFSGFLLYPEF